MDAARVIRDVRTRSGMTQRELAERAGTSAAAICLYESGKRVPRVDTLRRIVAAADATLVLETVDEQPLDLVANARVLEQVLELAEQLPFRTSRELDAPSFASLAS